jgi:hypothetical protein
MEETGLLVTVGRVLEIGSGPYREVSLAFECQIVADGGFQPSHETDRMAYFAPSSLPPMTSAQRGLLERALTVQAGHRAPMIAPPVETPSNERQRDGAETEVGRVVGRCACGPPFAR